MQTTNIVLMVRPANFGFNEQTANTNTYQNKEEQLSASEIQDSALKEFDGFVNLLQDRGVSVLVIPDTVEPKKPDAIFPNNWLTTHESGTVFLYPMMEESRRLERRPEIIEALKKDFKIREVIDLSYSESQGLFLEGTGSMVFDHGSKTVYACSSPRTSREAFLEFAGRIGYKPIMFRSLGHDGQELYHTNVMMSIGEGFAVIGLETIPDKDEQQLVRQSLENSQLIVIELTSDQVNHHFAGNMLQVLGEDGTPILVMSEQAHQSLSNDQKEALEQFTDILPISIPLIEKVGGGSVRCMMAEVFLPLQGMSTFF